MIARVDTFNDLNNGFSQSAERAHQDDKHLTIFTFTGGGSLGLISAYMAEEFEEETGKRLYEHADRLAGTSVGALHAATQWPLENTGKPLFEKGQLREFYENELHGTLFPKRLTSVFGLFGPRYKLDRIESAVDKIFGDLKLSDFKDGLHIHVVDRETGRPRIFKSEDAKQDPSENFMMRDLLRAAIAAPLVFKQVAIKNMAGETMHITDAGKFTNDPSFWAYDDAIKEGYDPQELSITTFSTGHNEKTRMADPNSGLYGSGISEARKHFEVVANGLHDVLYHRLGADFVFIGYPLPEGEISMTSDVEDIKPFAEQAAKNNPDLEHAITVHTPEQPGRLHQLTQSCNTTRSDAGPQTHHPSMWVSAAGAGLARTMR